MKQTNNAIKFLLAQYRSIFKSAYLKGLVSAVVLTTGLAASASTANAAAVTTTLDKLGTEEGVANDTDKAVADVLNANDIWLGKLTIDSSGSTENSISASGTAVIINESANAGSLEISGDGKGISLKGGADGATLTVNLDSVSVATSGDLVLNASESNVTLSATTLSLGESGTVTLTGGDTADTKVAVLDLSNGSLTTTGDTKKANIELTNNSTLKIKAEDLNTIYGAEGKGLVLTASGDADTKIAKIDVSGSLTLASDKIILSNGTNGIHVGNNAVLAISETLNITGSDATTVENISGTISTQDLSFTSGSSYTVNGGIFEIANSLSADNQVTFSGATIELGTEISGSLIFDDDTKVSVTDKQSRVTSGSIKLGDGTDSSGSLTVESTESNEASLTFDANTSLDLASGSVSVSGPNALLDVSNATLNNTENKEVSITISSGASFTAKSAHLQSFISSGDKVSVSSATTDISGIVANGDLEIADNKFVATGTAGIFIGENGLLDVTGKLTISDASDDGIDLSNVSGVIEADTLKFSGADAGFTVSGTAETTSLIVNQSLESNAELTLSNIILDLGNAQSGNISSNLIANTGAVINVTSGSWTVSQGKSIKLNSGSLAINTGATLTTDKLTSESNSDSVTIAGTLNINGDGSGTTADFTFDNTEEATGSDGESGVVNGGTLNLNKVNDTLGGISFSGSTITAENASQIFVQDGGKVVIDLADIEGIGADGITIDQLNALKEAIFASGSNGLLQLASGSSIDVDLGDFTSGENGYNYDDVKDVITNTDAFQNEAVAIDVSNISSSVAGTVGNLVLTGTVNPQSDLLSVSSTGLNVGKDGLVASYKDGDTFKAVGLDLGTDGKLTTYGTNAVTGSISGSGTVTVSQNLKVVANGETVDSTTYGNFEAGSVKLSEDGSLTAGNITLNKADAESLKQGNINASGTVNLTGTEGSVVLGGININATDNVNVNNDLSMTSGSVTTDGDIVLSGNQNSVTGGTLVANTIQGAVTFGNTTTPAPQAMLARTTAAQDSTDLTVNAVLSSVGGTYTISQGSIVAVRTGQETADEVKAAVNQAIVDFAKPEEVTSVLYLKDIDTALSRAPTQTGIAVGSTPTTATAGDFTASSGSLTIIDDSSITATLANLSGDAKVYVANVNNGETILSGTITVDTTAWQGDNAIVANKFLALDIGSTAIKVVENTDAAKAYSLLTGEEFAYVKDVALATQATSSFDNGDYLVSDIINGFNGDTYAQQSAITSVGRFAQMAGVETIAMSTINVSSNAILQRMGIASTSSSLITADNPSNSASLWLAPTYTTIDASGFDAGAFSYGTDIDMTGLALGFDTLTQSGVRVGAMFNMGSGDSESQDTYINTTNDFDFFGFSIYAGTNFGNFGLTADAGYHFISNDVEQNNIEKLKADIDSSAVTLGVNGKYTFEFGMFSVAPHAGLRFNRINVDSYDVKASGHTVLTADDETLNILQIPVGVTVASEFNAGELKIQPSFDLTITAATGDTDADSDITWISDFNSASYSYTTEVFDSVSYSATAGVSAYMGNCNFGLGLNYTGSSNTNEFGVSANARFVF